MDNKYQIVEESIFRDFVSSHPKAETMKVKTERGFFDDPITISANDFSDGKEYPESIVAYMTQEWPDPKSLKCKYTFYILKD